MNRQALWLTVVAVALGVGTALAVIVSKTDYVDFNQWHLIVRDSSYRALLQDFSRASPVAPRPMGNDSTGWDFDVSLPGGVRVSVRARSHMDAVRVKYSDEPEERELYRYIDYSNPVSLRTKGRVLYVYWTETLLGTSHWVIAYDLFERRQLSRKRLVQGDITVPTY
jgi:hypothetical protein